MAESLYYKHGTSDEFNNPYCDICYEAKKVNVRPEGYCHECFQCLCKDCLVVHTRLTSTKDHVVRTGEDMPKSQEDKPPSGNTKPMSEIKTQKDTEYDIKLRDRSFFSRIITGLNNDKYECFITGLSITPDGRRLLADCNNSKIKMFSRDMTIISSLTLPARPRDIAVTGDREAVVSLYDGSKLFIIDVSDKQMSIRRIVELSFEVWGIVTHKDKLIVTSLGSSPRSVKLIDHSGQVHWSTSTDQQGQRLFSRPLYVSCYDDGRSSTVNVTDSGNNTLTLLNSDTGDVIRRHKIEGKWPRGVTTDTAGNIYVCYWKTGEVAVLSRNFSEEKIILTQLDGISGSPQAIVYDAEDHRLLASYYCSNVVDCFKLL